jgi:hypothetical protein
VCVGVALNTFFFLSFSFSSLILSPTGKTFAGRLPTGYHSFKRRETLWDSHGTVFSLATQLFEIVKRNSQNGR